MMEAPSGIFAIASEVEIALRMDFPVSLLEHAVQIVTCWIKKGPSKAHHDETEESEFLVDLIADVPAKTVAPSDGHQISALEC